MNGIGYVCKYHGCAVPGHDACEQCMKERESLPVVETMTKEERAREFEMWINRDQLTVKWDVFLTRLEALLGRGIWTHELASSNCEHLVKEAWGKVPPPSSISDILRPLVNHDRNR